MAQARASAFRASFPSLLLATTDKVTTTVSHSSQQDGLMNYASQEQVAFAAACTQRREEPGACRTSNDTLSVSGINVVQEFLHELAHRLPDICIARCNHSRTWRYRRSFSMTTPYSTYPVFSRRSSTSPLVAAHRALHSKAPTERSRFFSTSHSSSKSRKSAHSGHSRGLVKEGSSGVGLKGQHKRHHRSTPNGATFSRDLASLQNGGWHDRSLMQEHQVTLPNGSQSRKHGSRRSLTSHRHPLERLKDSSRDPTRLQKLLRSHNVIRKNYVSLQQSSTVYDSFCRLCLEAVCKAQLIERSVCRTVHPYTPNEQMPPEFPSSANSVLIVRAGDNSQASKKAAVDAPVGAKVHTVHLLPEEVSWICNPFTIPELPDDALLRWLPRFDVASAGGMSTQGPDTVETNSLLGGIGRSDCEDCYTMQWREAWREQEVPGAVIFDCFGMVAPTPAAGSDNYREFVQLLQTVAFFKWVKDDTILKLNGESVPNSPPTAETNASQDSTSAEILARVRAHVKELVINRDDASSEGASGTQRTTNETLQLANEWLERKRAMLREAQQLIQRIPRTDSLVASTDSSMPRIYEVHVLDLLYNILFRFLMPHWPSLSSLDRGILFRLATCPWYTRDYTQRLAMWYTYMEVSHPKFGLEDHFPFVQNLRLLSWPTLMDYHSGIVQRALHVSVAGARPEGDSEAVSCVDSEEKGKEAPESDWSSDGMHLKQLIAVLYATERKQRLSHELLYLFFYQLHTALLRVSGGKSEDAPCQPTSLAARRALLRSFFSRTTIALCIYVLDADRFLTKQFFRRIHAEQRWLLLPKASGEDPGCAPHSTTSSVDDGIMRFVMRRALDTREPYALSRIVLAVLAGPIAEHWSSLSSRRHQLLWDTWMRSIALPIQHALAFTTDEKSEPSASSASVTAAWATLVPLHQSLEWDHNMHSILTHGVVRELQELPLVQRNDPAGGAPHGSSSDHGEGGMKRLTRDISERFFMLVHVATFLSTCIPTPASDATDSPASLAKFRGKLAPVVAGTIRQFLSQWPSGELDSVVSDWIPRWPLPKNLLAPASLTWLKDEPYVSLMYESLSTFLTPVLRQEVHRWVLQVSLVQHQTAQAVGVSSPTLQRWCVQVAEEDLGLHKLTLSFSDLFHGLSELVMTRLGERQPEVDTTTDPGGNSETRSDVAQLPLLTPAEVQVVLRVLSGVYTRGGLSVLRQGAPSVFSTITNVLLVDCVPSAGQTASRPSVADVKSDAAAAPPNLSPVAGGRQLLSAEVKSRMFDIEQAVVNATRHHAAELPLVSLLDALHLSVVPLTTVGTIYAEHCSSLEGGQAYLTPLGEAVRGRSHTALIAGLVLMRHFPFAFPSDGGWHGLDASLRREVEARSDLQAVADFVSGTLEVLIASDFEAARGEKENLSKTVIKAADAPAPKNGCESVPNCINGVPLRDGHMTPMIDQARTVSRAFVWAAWIYTKWASSCRHKVHVSLPSVCHRAVTKEIAYALFLRSVNRALPCLDRGCADEIFLWLAVATTVALKPSSRGDREVEDRPLFEPPLLSHGRLISWPTNSTPIMPPKPTTDLLACVPSSVDDVSGFTGDGSVSPATLREWFEYLFAQLLPILQTEVTRNSRVPQLRHLVTVLVSLRIYQALGVPLDLRSFHADVFLQRAAAERRLVLRHSHLFMAATACFPSLGTVFLPVASYLRDARDVLTIKELERAFASLSLSVEAFAVQHDNQQEQQHLREKEREEVLQGLSGESVVHERYGGMLPSHRGSPPQLRQAWSALTNRLLESELSDVPLSLFVCALRCGAAVGCVDTRIFEQALSYVIMGGRVGELGLAQWAMVVQACGSTRVNREDMEQLLCPPVLAFVDVCVVDGLGQALQLPTVNERRQRYSELNYFVESLPSLFIAHRSFWMEVRKLLESWCMELRHAPGISAAEITEWPVEWRQSFNWSVQSAGHMNLMVQVHDRFVESTSPG